MRHGVLILPEHRWQDARRRWVRAEQYGFDHAWTYDQLMWRWLRDKPWFGTVPTLTAAAAATERIKLGTMVATPTYRHPVPFAKDVMTLDDISGGRFVCGLGAGAGAVDDLVVDSTVRTSRERADRFAEFVALTDLLLRQHVTSYLGEHYSADEVWMSPGCVQTPRTPFAIAATGPRGMRLAAKYAQTWITAGPPATFDAHPYEQVLPEIAAQVRAAEDACVAVGRDPATLRRLLLTGAAVGGVLASVESWRDAAGRFAEVGVTDLVVHWPRADFPYAGDESVLADIACDLTGAHA
ncbi:LLM class flavin-dependent oxidoreductase [Kutzneria kofuensis]|uniref:Alkanesulfonate monooxygenase SsuD/methylene tetrahydromethanopterin reductase-like flavin-dependent oxidoreductase (Luciferase family) n=1 Tax=Kutzneria kofuensis TaxID=103725 RepID=A0A7W9NLK0_9PSEU|nr:LLM class flavin-dependent oxidoreductase [Kutzneria kofuensis]MBB5897787.1 alkanesulfonate monooxygenase SsuD/methylene tetrahydromethanopterin reductase-like flavin-dependent oxidoreductase (luciferase family) [Kutzneria kofuensis]